MGIDGNGKLSYSLKIMKNIKSGAGSRRLPPSMRLGFFLLGVGVVLDLAYHLVLAVGSGEASSHSGGFATSVHGIVLAGMAVTFGGLVQFALRPQRVVERKERQ